MAGRRLGAVASCRIPTAGFTEHSSSDGFSTTPFPLRSRTRRLHALLALDGDIAASVHSTRRAEQVRGVTLTFTGGEQTQALALAPIEARQLACALWSAAEALELAQRHRQASSQVLAEGGPA